MNKLLTTSEWEIMRVIWTLGEATTNQIIHIMHNQKDWQPSTVKTLINRIQKKRIVTYRWCYTQPLIHTNCR